MTMHMDSPVAGGVDVRLVSVLDVEERSKHEPRADLISPVPCEVGVPHGHQVTGTLTVHLHSITFNNSSVSGTLVVGVGH